MKRCRNVNDTDNVWCCINNSDFKRHWVMTVLSRKVATICKWLSILFKEAEPKIPVLSFWSLWMLTTTNALVTHSLFWRCHLGKNPLPLYYIRLHSSKHSMSHLSLVVSSFYIFSKETIPSIRFHHIKITGVYKKRYRKFWIENVQKYHLTGKIFTDSQIHLKLL